MHTFEKWRESLQFAPDVPSVIAIVRDYREAIRQLLPVLPADCRTALEAERDVQAAAVALLHAELRFEGSEDVRKLLHEAAHLFASAAVRITMLHVRLPGTDDRESRGGGGIVPQGGA